MDIAVISQDSIKLKIKKTSLIANPRSSITKTEADAIIVTDKNIDASRVNDYRVLIEGAGEYEVSGLKIIVSRIEDSLMFNFIHENTEAIMASSSVLAKLPTDKIKEYPIAIINVDTPLPENVITSMEPRVIILYGAHAKEAARTLGKENISPSSKVSFSEDKLPEETEIYLLS
jgi:hypothetical protein